MASLLYSEFVLAFGVAIWIGVPIVIALELALCPSGERRWWRSVFMAVPLSAIVFVACVFWQFLGYGRVGIAAGIAAGALAAVPLPRIWASAARAVSQPT